jgi:inosine/xanthosine triphosphate pyrophosphatase family protein
MKDADGVLYFEGIITGDFMGWEPKDDYGEGFGCTSIFYPDGDGFRWEEL